MLGKGETRVAALSRRRAHWCYPKWRMRGAQPVARRDGCRLGRKMGTSTRSAFAVFGRMSHVSDWPGIQWGRAIGADT